MELFDHWQLFAEKILNNKSPKWMKTENEVKYCKKKIFLTRGKRIYHGDIIRQSIFIADTNELSATEMTEMTWNKIRWIEN